MSLFDPLNEDKLADIYPEGTPFMLYGVLHEGIRPTAYGDTHMASVEAGPVDRSEGPRTYRVFGRLAEACKQVEPGELPAKVVLARVGRAITWQPAPRDESTPF